ncbi:MAG: hypothetical protein JWN02_2850, partial [Acidobacteria bacterium]|nr:hypothetical protein [Acidobacteriota bacterium]
SEPFDWRFVTAATACCLPLLLFIVYALWRGAVTPPTSPDAMIYHLPRAVMIERAHGFERFPDAPDFRINVLAANYELLLADALLVDGSDRLTEWISVLFFALLLLATAALAKCWWGGRIAPLAAMLAVASMPVLLLAAPNYKNDAMANFFFVSALLWSGRWLRTRDLPSALLAIIAICAGLGTKNHGLVLAATLLAVMTVSLWRQRERSCLRQALILGTALLASLPLLGGDHYLLAVTGGSIGNRKPQSDALAPIPYGGWKYLVETPVAIVAAPFLGDADEVRMPFTSEWLLWPRYDLYASNYGAALSLLALALPFAIVRYRRDEPQRGRERLLGGLAALIFVAAILPMKPAIDRFICAYPRYMLFAPVVVVCLTLAPFVARLERQSLQRRAWLIAIAFAVLFALNAADMMVHDKWAPLAYVRRVAVDPRTPQPGMPNRAALVVDRLAAPNDVIDVHGGTDSWLYPAYGKELARDVRTITTPAQIRPSAQWVVVDRADTILWHDPRFTSISAWRRYLGHGTATAEDLAVVNALLRDPRYECVFLDRKLNQAVFRRR